MKIKTSLALVITLSAIIFMACSDDLGSIGNNIQPDGDDIIVGTDTITFDDGFSATTAYFNDSIYARTIYGMLGEYLDPTFGKVKSDYLCEFFCPEDVAFRDENKMKSIDSVFLDVQFASFSGDSVSPMGLAVYEVKKSLKPFFFTSVNPSKYLTENDGEKPHLLGQTMFAIQDVHDTVYSSVSTAHIKTIPTRLDLSLGNRFYNEWKTNKETFKNSDKLKEFFKGVYVTTTFGSGSLIEVESTSLVICYTYNLRNAANTADSSAVGIFRLQVTPEVIQMNRINNSLPKLEDDRATKTYLKTPAGAYTELTIPLAKILGSVNAGQTINAAELKIKGFTEEEERLRLIRPSTVLLINKDSLANFFFNRKLHDAKTSFVVSRSASNTYDFGNVASIINHYAKIYEGVTDPTKIKDLNYLIIPISVSTSTVNNTTVITDIYNMMMPRSAILRTDPSNLKMPIIYSKYNRVKN